MLGVIRARSRIEGQQLRTPALAGARSGEQPGSRECRDRVPAVQPGDQTAGQHQVLGVREDRCRDRGHRAPYSHSIVPGGFDVTSSTTRLTSRTPLVIRFEIFESTSYGRRVQSAVIASSLETGRSTIGWP